MESIGILGAFFKQALDPMALLALGLQIDKRKYGRRRDMEATIECEKRTESRSIKVRRSVVGGEGFCLILDCALSRCLD
jgi:hypothetical protein